MKTSILRELPLLLMIAVPFTYLAIIWNDLPAEIPMHYDMEGKVNRYGSKNELALVTFLLPTVIYVIMLVLPWLDPKGKIEKMGNKYHRLKFMMVLFMVVLATYFLYISHRGGDAPPNGAIALIGLFFAVMGNYFQSIQPNYFLGIRTPWTLENETVWRATHKMAGRIWMVGGILIAVLGFLLPANIFMMMFIGAIAVMALVPIIYSYVKFREIKKQLKAEE